MAKLAKPVGFLQKDAVQYRMVLRDEVDVPIYRGVVRAAELSSTTSQFVELGYIFAIEQLDKRLLVSAPKRINGFFKTLSVEHRRRFVKAHQGIIGIPVAPFLSEPPIRQFVEQGLKNNVQLIKKIGREHLPKVLKQVREVYADRPFDQHAMESLFRREWGYRDYPLRRIARDQVSKAMGQMNQIRQQQIGVTKFEWQTAGDERVRESHAAHDGLIFNWSDPPPNTGPPGADYQCRCVALAVFD